MGEGAKNRGYGSQGQLYLILEHGLALNRSYMSIIWRRDLF